MVGIMVFAGVISCCSDYLLFELYCLVGCFELVCGGFVVVVLCSVLFGICFARGCLGFAVVRCFY